MALPTEPTAAYVGNPSAEAEPDPVRVALVGGSGPVAVDDLHRLLRRRLLVLSSLIAGGFLVGLSVSFVIDHADPLPPGHALHGLTPAAWAAVNWRAFLNLAASGTAAVVLWRWPPRTVRGLRLIEIGVVGILTVIALTIAIDPIPYGFLQRAAGEPFEVREAFIGRYVLSGSLIWTINITLYATLIPNTLRRCATVVAVMAVSPLVLIALNAFWLRPLAPEIAAHVLLVHALHNFIAVAIAVFASSRIEHYRQQASEARKLGQYVLREKLGAGGMGEVYRAEHALLRRPCALKTIRPEQAGDQDTLRRFEREVQTTATLTHPNTVQVFDYGHAADGTFYYVMEYLTGMTLEELVRQHGPLSPGRAVHFLRQVCAALSEAHARGLTHRDIKPGNVMICERGGVCDVAKVLDFGLVRMPKEDSDGETLTRDGAVAGTPAYMSPEQAGGQDGIDSRSDIYSVGAVAYFLLTGKPPFADRSAVKMMAAHLYEAPAPLPAEVPADLAAIVLRCLAKPPGDRWPDVPTLEAALSSVSTPAWTARDATAWWKRTAQSDGETGCALATASWAEPRTARARGGTQ
jgi:eukaryotic-like serine/threonine-protein kinase